MTTEELLRIPVAVYLLKRKGEVLPQSNSAFYLLKSQDPDKWENFKAWNILKSTPKILEPQSDSSVTTEDKNEEEDAISPPNEVNVEDQASSTADSGNDPNEEKEENEIMMNVSSTSSYKPSDDSSTSTSIVNVVSHASRPKKQHLSRVTANVNLQCEKQREQQTKLLSEMHDTMKDSKKQSAESLMTMQLKSYYKMCKHYCNDEGCNAAMDAAHDLLSQSSVLPIAMVQTTEDDDGGQEEL